MMTENATQDAAVVSDDDRTVGYEEDVDDDRTVSVTHEDLYVWREGRWVLSEEFEYPYDYVKFYCNLLRPAVDTTLLSHNCQNLITDLVCEVLSTYDHKDLMFHFSDSHHIYGIVSLEIRVYHPFTEEDVLERLRLNFAEAFSGLRFLNNGSPISVLPMWWAL